MIQIDMNKKRSMNVINKSFHLENDVLVLAVEPLEYELEGKTITAVFEPSKIETGALEAIDGVIQIPIYSSMIQVGVNFIQLNFRWDTTKLEQSGKLMWVIDKSLITEGAPQEDVDIISYLINEVKRVVGETGDIKEALDESVVNANTINSTLSNEVTGTIKVATDVGIDLEDTIEDANYTKGLVEATIDDSEVAKTDLEGTVVVAGNTQSNLNAKIGEATTSKQALDQAIIDNQIVKKSEFTAHKEDYANLVTEVNKKANKQQEGWITPTLLNGWVNFSTTDIPSYFKDTLGFVHLRGWAKSGTSISIFRLPEGYRPSTMQFFNTISTTGNVVGTPVTIRIESRGAYLGGGYISVLGDTSGVSFSGISFYAGV